MKKWEKSQVNNIILSTKNIALESGFQYRI